MKIYNNNTYKRAIGTEWEFLGKHWMIIFDKENNELLPSLQKRFPYLEVNLRKYNNDKTPTLSFKSENTRSFDTSTNDKGKQYVIELVMNFLQSEGEL
jgi:hypothetical protein